MTNNTPSFICVGAKKCGTTWLSEALREHPDIFVSNPKEIGFFSNESRFNKGPVYYNAFFKNANNFLASGEFSPAYLTLRKCAKRIFEYDKDLKIIILVRNPIERFFSDWKMYNRTRGEVRLDLKKLESLITSRSSLLTDGLYFDLIKQYLAFFPTHQIIILTQEEMSSNPKNLLKKVYRFLNVKYYEPTILNRKISVGGIPKSIFLERLRIHLHSKLKYSFPKMITLFKTLGFTEFYRTALYKKENKQIDEDVSKKLKQYYKSDLILLNEYFSIDYLNE